MARNGMVLGILFLLITPHAYSDETESSERNVSQLIRDLFSENKTKRLEALEKLVVLQNRSNGKLDTKDKNYLFDNLIAAKKLDGFVYSVSKILAGMPASEKILEKARTFVKNGNSVEVFVSLIYLDRHGSDEVAAYFSNKKYEDLPKLTTQIFKNNATLILVRNDYFDRLILKHLNWVPDKADQSDPYRSKILAEGELIAKYIALNFNKYASSEKNNLDLVWIMGELADPAAFSVLIEEYKKKPNDRLAISIGACMSIEQLKTLAEIFKDAPIELQQLLKIICGKEWSKIKDKGDNEILKYIKDDYVNIRKNCMNRSIPSLG